MSSAPSLAVRSIFAIALMVGFYMLALMLAGGLLYFVYADLVYSRTVHGRLIVFCVVGAGLILWSIVPRPDPFVAPGPRLEPAESPRLFESLSGIARLVEQPMPAEVYLTNEVNAWVAQRGGVMGFGSRRVMGLGHPLLQLLTVGQLSAVLAHEFGHFHGGDTKLGPWIYKTRAAIARTLQNLARQRSVLVYPFVWYGNMFLRVTHAISRRQEFSADALASRVVGSRPLTECLRAIHGAAPAFEAYWNQEAAPVLDQGFRPPLAEGFARFLGSPSVAPAVSQGLEKELSEAKTDPYDTHPALRERIAAVARFTEGGVSAPDPPAISLLGNVEELEIRLLAGEGGEDEARELKPVAWDETGSRVFLPAWETYARKQASALAGVTAAELPDVSKDLVGLGFKMSVPPGQLPSREQRAAMASELLGVALALALHRQGWTPHAEPGELYLQRGGVHIEPFWGAPEAGCRRLIAGAVERAVSRSRDSGSGSGPRRSFSIGMLSFPAAP